MLGSLTYQILIFFVFVILVINVGIFGGFYEVGRVLKGFSAVLDVKGGLVYGGGFI